MKKTVLVLGATGLVGSHILQQLLEDDRYGKVIALVRRPLEITNPKLQVAVIDFDHPDPSVVKGDELYCALGTTLSKAGSKAAQYRIDGEYPMQFGKMARQNGVKQYLLVSSIGADAGSGNFYLRTKGELEQNIQSLNFDNFVTARPSFLLGNRAEFRLGERIGIFFAQVFRPLFPAKYQGIDAKQVASALILSANQGLTGMQVLEGKNLLKVV